MLILNIENDTFETDYRVVNKENEIIFYPDNYDVNSFYTIIKYNKLQKKIIFIQDDIGDLKQYYYTLLDNHFIIDTTITTILRKMSKKELDDNSIYYFLSCGFIPNERTLVKNIYKVVPGKTNIYDPKKEKIYLKNKSFFGNSLFFNSKKYKKILIDDMFNYTDRNKKMGFAISSGFDSNLLISLYNKIDLQEKDYFCIGGQKGVNEIPIAEKILKNYKIRNFKYSLVTDKTLNDYPQIVYLYEGLFYERGIFLQYELYKLCCKENLNIILGEGADQILHCNAKKRHNIKKIITKRNFSLYKNCPLELLQYVVLKKSSILLSRTNNNLIYPYLYKNFRHYNYNFGFYFGYDKKKHKKIVNDEVVQNIRMMLNKIGGATEQNALYKDEIIYNKLKDVVLNSKFSKIKCEHNTTELSSDDDYILKILYLIIFEKIFINGNNYDYNYIKNIHLNDLLDM